MPHAHAAAPLKAVPDTNIYVAAFGHPKGRTATLWTAALDRRYALLMSPAIIREMARVLGSDFIT
jgi:predicted nucleic acid-binding protein